MHEGFMPGAVSPAGSLSIPAPFEFASPCAEEDHRSQDSPGVTGQATVNIYIHGSKVRPQVTG